MAIDLLYFAWIREAIGCDGETVDPPDNVTTAAELIDWLSARGDGYADAFADKGRIRVAIDQEFAGLEKPLAGAREVALFPPVTGG
ncbi:molybdopterin converting factor subunit 1 [Parasphingopyxis lamellibrachiae]|uniref:Molybdopterin synthase sulfur carrier subunit n=1 Tax=Parasphingopyxis lamellibrachiae TaxID=680125 RepID=A0A3D9FBA7_9SPHN|nr:molybdopterin converting factor subunit 1 [Parasphingopyxis lamellibrachiae]RED15109.1 molybdopterin synthase subunit MoaD [Parasphingopyxis lamellibrachiae]